MACEGDPDQLIALRWRLDASDSTIDAPALPLLGTPEELLAGGARHRQPLVVGDGIAFLNVTPGR